MKLAKLLLILHRSDLITLSTMTYTSMQGLGFYLSYCYRYRLCLVGIKSKAIALRGMCLYTDNMKQR